MMHDGLHQEEGDSGARGSGDMHEQRQESNAQNEMRDESKRKQEEERNDEPARKSQSLPWTAGNLPPDADLTVVGSIMQMGVSANIAH